MMKKMTQKIECPNHEGSFDCTPFCPICEGEQEYEVWNKMNNTLEEVMFQVQNAFPDMYAFIDKNGEIVICTGIEDDLWARGQR